MVAERVRQRPFIILHAPERAVAKAFVMRALASPIVPALLVRAPQNGALIAIAARDRPLVFALSLALLLGLLLFLALLAQIVLNKVFKRGSNLLETSSLKCSSKGRSVICFL